MAKPTLFVCNSDSKTYHPAGEEDNGQLYEFDYLRKIFTPIENLEVDPSIIDALRDCHSPSTPTDSASSTLRPNQDTRHVRFDNENDRGRDADGNFIFQFDIFEKFSELRKRNIDIIDKNNVRKKLNRELKQNNKRKRAEEEEDTEIEDEGGEQVDNSNLDSEKRRERKKEIKSKRN